MKNIVVIPHHLPTLDFLKEWEDEFNNLWVIIVDDRPDQSKKIEVKNPNYIVFSHKDIDKDLGKKSWIIPRGTSAIRSYGLYKAWQQKPDMILTLDNDCFPDGSNLIEGHARNLMAKVTLDWRLSTTIGFMPELYSRGAPYSNRDKSDVYLSHGLWSNIPDLDAATMLLNPNYRTKPSDGSAVILPRYNFYPMCGMNLAFRPEITPLMYFGLFGKQYGFDQFDDIWAGIFSKKIMDHLGWAVASGYPSVEHRKQSDAITNFEKQAGGMRYNEQLWQIVKDVHLGELTDPIGCYKKIIYQVATTFNDDYWKKVYKATLIWLDLFK